MSPWGQQASPVSPMRDNRGPGQTGKGLASHSPSSDLNPAAGDARIRSAAGSPSLTSQACPPTPRPAGDAGDRHCLQAVLVANEASVQEPSTRSEGEKEATGRSCVSPPVLGVSYAACVPLRRPEAHRSTERGLCGPNQQNTSV